MPHPTRWLLAAAGTSASLALAPSAIAQEPVQPIIKPGVCVERLQTTEGGPRDGGLRAQFWYERYGGGTLDIERGPDNLLTPADTPLVSFGGIPSVPTHFETEGLFAFAVDLADDPVSWRLFDPVSGDGGVAQTNTDYQGRCIHAAFVEAPAADQVLPSGSPVRFTWTAEVSGVREFQEAGAADVPWSAWRRFHDNEHEPKCSLDGIAVACADADVELTDLAPGEHVFRVYAQPPRPQDVGPEAGSEVNDGLFELRRRFIVAAPALPIEEPKPPVEEPKPPVEEPKPPVQDPKPQVDPQPQLPLQPQPQLQPTTVAQPPVTPQPKVCVKRAATVTVPGRPGQRYRSVKVTVNGKRVTVRRVNGRLVATVAPSTLARTTSSVRITVRHMNGKRQTLVRNVRTCF